MKYTGLFILLLLFTLLASCKKNVEKKQAESRLPGNLAALISECVHLQKAGSYDSLINAGRTGLRLSAALKKDREISLFAYYTGVGFQGREQRDSAIVYFKNAAAIARRLKYIENLVDVQVQQASLYYDYGMPDSLNLQKNKMIAEADTLKNMALKMKLRGKLAFIYAKTGQSESALKTYFELLTYAEHQKDSIAAGLQLQSIANVYAEMSEFKKAVDYGVDAIKFLKTSQLDLMICYNDVGTYYVDVKKYYQAIGAFQQSIDIATQCRDTAYREATYVSIASPYIELRRYEKATDYLNKALAYYNKSGYELGFMYTMMMYGKIEAKENNTAKAIGYFEKALAAAHKTGHLDTETYIYSLLADISGKSTLYKKAYEYQVDYNRLNDSLTQKNAKRNIADLEVKYQSNEKEQKITLLKQQTRLKDIQLSDQRRKWWFLVVVVCFLVVTAFLLYRSYQVKRNSNKLLEEKNRTLNVLNEELNEANSSKTKLFSILSHDLRAPVSSLFQFLTIQKNHAGKLSSEQELKHNKRITQSAENLMESMEDLLIWSKSQMDSFSINASRINACEVINYTANINRDFAEDRKLTIAIDCSDDITLVTDINFLKIVLRNIVSNAIKFTPSGGHIKILAEQIDGFVNFKICDSGKGITKEQVDTLFEWNSIRSDSSGLGLKLAKEFVTRLNGSIKVDSVPGNGTIFTIAVPETPGDLIRS